MRFGSVCSGIEAASVAWAPLGWSAAWVSEIEPFPCAVLAHHYPTVPNFGDMTALPGFIAGGMVEAPDVLCGGTPCQAFSVAGLRKSLGDARGNLSLTFCEIANAIDDSRHTSPPAIVFWENVPGVLSTDDNAFGCFLAGLAGEDDALEPAGKKWGHAGAVYGPRRTVAWRTLDAQYFGLAQRRKRVFVVASARSDFDPVAVLFEFDGVRRDTAPSREAGQGVAATLDARTDGGGFPGSDGACGGHVVAAPDLARCVATREGSSQDYETTTMIAHSLRAEGFDASEDGTGRGTPLTLAFNSNAMPDQQRFDPHVAAAAALTRSQESAVAFTSKDYGGDAGPISPTLRSMGHSGSHANGGGGQVAVAVDCRNASTNDHIAGTLEAAQARGNRGVGALTGMQVRRLTPRECERLQGFPDDYTLVPNRGKPAADGPRYKALGNSWAVPVVTWIGARIAAQLQ